MTRALLFLLVHSLKNRVGARIRRLQNPKYLISALAGLGYLYFAFLHQPFMRTGSGTAPAIPLDPGVPALVELAFTCMLIAFVIFQFFFSNARIPLFDEAEIQFLFPAPMSRGSIMDYRIAKAQAGILFGSIVTVFIFGRGLEQNPAFLLIATWAVYTLLYLYRMAVVLAKQSLLLRGQRGARIRRAIAAWILLTLIFLIASAQWFYPSPPRGEELSPGSLVDWIGIVSSSGPVYYVLLPFRSLVLPAFSRNGAELLRHLIPVIGAIAVFYVGIRGTKSGFEASVSGGSAANSSDDFAGSKRPLVKARRPPFRLKPAGFAPMAIYWKNLSLAGGMSLRQTFPAILALGIVSILLVGASGEQVSIILGSACAALAGFLALMGPILFRDDLRTDLRNIDLLKTYPIPGWGIVLGEVLGPATVLLILQWILVFLSAIILPSVEEHPWGFAQRFYIGSGAAILLPCLSFIGILVQNAAALLLPGWIQLGREHQRGVEAMGQRLLSSFATVLTLVIAAIPAALLFAVTWIAGYWVIGLAAVPIAALVAGLGLLVEGAVGILLLGRLFERFDPSEH